MEYCLKYRQGAKQSINDLSACLTRLFRAADIKNDTHKRETFLGALRPEIRATDC